MVKEKVNMFEVYFEWWLNALKQVGLVLDWKKEPESLVLLDPVTIYSTIHMKRKEDVMADHDLMKMATYTRDYDAWVHRSLLDVLFGIIVKYDNTYFLRELTPRDKGDAWYDFAYYYLQNDEELDKDYVRVSFDVKPPSAALRFSGALGSSREFPYNQKLMLERHGILVNKVVPVGAKECLFNKTFIPDRYYFTDAGKQTRKLKEKDRNIKQWMQQMNLKPIPF